MKLDLSALFENAQEAAFFSHSLDLSHIKQRKHKPFISLVEIEGCAQNRSGIVSMSYTAQFTFSALCDRCLTEVTKERKVKFKHDLLLTQNEEGNDEWIVVPTAVLDLDELVTADLLLNLPIQSLCSEECKGLCSQCGVNLNEQTCSCSRKQIDPRLEALRDLLN